METKKRFTYNGTQLKPCIMAKARHALSITEKRPINKTRCSREYWAMAVEAMARHHNIVLKEPIANAKAKFTEYIN